jgi:hypothetical protein
VYFGKVALPGRTMAMGSIMAVATHSADSSTAVVAASVCWVSTSEAIAVASEIEGAAFALASVASSSAVA